MQSNMELKEQKERENFYRNSTLIVDHTNESFIGLLDHHLKNQNLTLVQFIQVKAHEIYHMCYNKFPCCMCPLRNTAPVFTYCNRILHPSQLDILLDTTQKLPGHKPNSRTKHCCCPANPNIKFDNLDLTLTRCLLVNFTTIIPDGSPERLAVEDLIKFRNESYGHATKGRITSQDYQIYKAQIERCILVLARVQNREAEFKQKLSDVQVRPLDGTIYKQYQTTLLANAERVQEVMQTLKKIECIVGIKSLPDCLVRDIKDAEVIEGCDAHFEIWTKEDGMCIEWLRDKLKIVNSDKFVIGKLGTIYSLNIRNTDLSDKGLYCVKVQDFERCGQLEVKEYFTKNLKKYIECIEGDKIDLSCEVLDPNVPAQWEKDGIILSSSVKYGIDNFEKTHRLSIIQTELDDSGKYSVKVNDRVRTTSLEVIEYFTETLHNQACLEGDDAYFECEILDDNEPAHWFKDGFEVTTSEKYEVKRQGRLHTLFVINTSLGDEGEYSVQIKNCVRKSKLEVKEYFAKIMDTFTCIEGMEAYFSCEVLEEDMFAQWFKDGVEVKTSKKYIVKCEGRIHRLKVLNTSLNDNGEYSVKIKRCVRKAELSVQEVPAAIHQLSHADKDLYLEIIKSGTEIRYYIRIIIIGENGVGKTCLLRRLLGDTVEGVESTDGVDILHRCKIKLHNGEWVFDEVMDKKKQLIARIKRAINENTSKTGNTLPYEIGIHVSSEEPHTYKMESSEDDEVSRNGQLNTKHQSIGGPVVREMDVIDESEDPKKEASFSKDMTSRSVTFSNQTGLADDQQDKGPITKVLTDSILKELSNFLTDFEKYDIPAEVLVDCGFWDFAGQRHYYPTHPVFLNPNAVHLLVADIMKDIQQINTENGFDKIGEYLDFWFDSIHSVRGIKTKHQNITEKYLQPPVIVVGTGIDKCKEKLEERKKKFCKQLLSMLHNEEKEKHLREICFVSNIEPSLHDFEFLRQSIFKCGKEMQTFGEKLPLRWIRLEHLLDIVREAGVNILSWLEIVKLCTECSVDNLNEIKLFFKYQHKVGSVIYFESLHEYIILNQKWLADAFRCLVSDKFDLDVQRTSEWKRLEEKGELEHSLIQKLFQKEPQLQFNKHKSHILNVMEIFGIIVKPPTLTGDENKQYYYMPCMISEQVSISKIYDLFKAKKNNCTRTPWLCIQFDFMPFDFFNHVMSYFMNRYHRHIAIYHGIGIFYLDSSQFRKFIVCFSKNTIAVQIWQWKKIETGTCKLMLKELESVIGIVKDKYEPRQVSFVVKAKCADGNIHVTNDRKSYKDLTNSWQEEYFCEEHSESHKTKDFFTTWFEDYSEEKDYVQTVEKSTGMTGIPQQESTGRQIVTTYQTQNITRGPTTLNVELTEDELLVPPTKRKDEQLAANEVTATAGSAIVISTTPSQSVSTIQNVSGDEDVIYSRTRDGLSDKSTEDDLADGVVLHTENDRFGAIEFINNMKDAMPYLHVKLGITKEFGVGISALEFAAKVFNSCRFLFIFVTPSFTTSDVDILMTNIAIIESTGNLTTKNRVIPVLTKKGCNILQLKPFVPLNYFRYLEAKAQNITDYSFLNSFKGLIKHGRKYLSSWQQI